MSNSGIRPPNGSPHGPAMYESTAAGREVEYSGERVVTPVPVMGLGGVPEGQGQMEPPIGSRHSDSWQSARTHWTRDNPTRQPQAVGGGDLLARYLPLYPYPPVGRDEYRGQAYDSELTMYHSEPMPAASTPLRGLAGRQLGSSYEGPLLSAISPRDEVTLADPGSRYYMRPSSTPVDGMVPLWPSETGSLQFGDPRPSTKGSSRPSTGQESSSYIPSASELLYMAARRSPSSEARAPSPELERRASEQERVRAQAVQAELKRKDEVEELLQQRMALHPHGDLASSVGGRSWVTGSDEVFIRGSPRDVIDTPLVTPHLVHADQPYVTTRGPRQRGRSPPRARSTVDQHVQYLAALEASRPLTRPRSHIDSVASTVPDESRPIRGSKVLDPELVNRLQKMELGSGEYEPHQLEQVKAEQALAIAESPVLPKAVSPVGKVVTPAYQVFEREHSSKGDYPKEQLAPPGNSKADASFVLPVPVGNRDNLAGWRSSSPCS